MKSLLTTLSIQNPAKHALEKMNVANNYITRGSPTLPQAPRDIAVQSANGGVQVTWKLPNNHTNIAGWRVYLNTESNLVVQIRDKGTRQAFVPVSSGPTPTAVNIMVSSFTTLGRESAKVVQQGTPLAQSTATTVPSAPPGYDEEAAGGGNRNLIEFNGSQAYLK